jgi:hypothetical protein
MRDEDEQFHLGDMENPTGIAQELSNLQALRRMSMDVSNTHDPDLQFQGMSMMAMPAVAPQGDDDEADPSRLLWVPAGVHPELAPTEFKNFLEKRVQSVRRRSRDSTLSVGSLGRSDSSGLSRKKSTLSRQVDSTGGRDVDEINFGRDGLRRQDSINLASDLTLDELVQDPSKAVQKLTLESQRQEPGPDDVPGDMPILPAAPGGGLRRSTRTQYRKGGSVKGGSLRSGGERLPFAKRMAARKEQEEAGESSNMETPEAPKGYGLGRVQSEPIGENFSRPNRSVRRQQTFSRELADAPYDDSFEEDRGTAGVVSEQPHTFSAGVTGQPAPVPEIVHTAAAEDEPSEFESVPHTAHPFPARSSSQKGVAQIGSQQSEPPPPEEPPARSSRRPNYTQLAQTPAPTPPPTQPLPPQPQQAPQSPHPPPVSQQYHQSSAEAQPDPRPQRTVSQGLGDMSPHATALSGGSASRTDTLTFIPTFSAEERKAEKKSKSSDGSSSKSSWKWFKSDDKDKKKKDEESKKSKSKPSVDKTHDNARLDVLQSSIDNAKPKGRESLVMDREGIDPKVEEERRKESTRKSTEPKKEKDGLFANFFSSSKKKAEKDSSGKKSSGLRPVSPEPAPYRPQQPDVDYHWTRFPILEERAIYRMAHMKLANPRRALYSQVLLSNFMYAYLAKVQAMHPQIQVPISPQQKRQQEEERRRQEQEQQYIEQQNAQDSIDRYNFEYHRVSTKSPYTPLLLLGHLETDFI